MGPIGERFPVLGAGVAPMFGADTAIHCGHCGRPDRGALPSEVSGTVGRRRHVSAGRSVYQ